MRHVCNSIEETRALAEVFVRQELVVKQCNLVLLEGLVGVGKSIFVRSALRYLGIDGAIPSPTFSLVNEYQRDVPLCISPARRIEVVCHVDLYRIQSDEAFFSLDLQECVREGLVFVEWAQNFPRSFYPYPYYCISITMPSPQQNPERRIITLTWHDA